MDVLSKLNVFEVKMDRRSWLWRRKSSEKSPSGETESSGSLSSHSERFSDDQVSHIFPLIIVYTDRIMYFVECLE